MIDPSMKAREIFPCWGDGINGPKECDGERQCELHFRLAAALREYGEAEYHRGKLEGLLEGKQVVEDYFDKK